MALEFRDPLAHSPVKERGFRGVEPDVAVGLVRVGYRHRLDRIFECVRCVHDEGDSLFDEQRLATVLDPRRTTGCDNDLFHVVEPVQPDLVGETPYEAHGAPVQVSIETAVPEVVECRLC